MNELKLLLAVFLLVALRWVARDPTTAVRLRATLLLPKGTDHSGFAQDDLDAIAFKLNSQPRKVHATRTPLEVYADYPIRKPAIDSSVVGTATVGRRQ